MIDLPSKYIRPETKLKTDLELQDHFRISSRNGRHAPYLEFWLEWCEEMDPKPQPYMLAEWDFYAGFEPTKMSTGQAACDTANARMLKQWEDGPKGPHIVLAKGAVKDVDDLFLIQERPSFIGWVCDIENSRKKLDDAKEM